MVRITRATTYTVGNPWKNWLFVRLDTDSPGLYGVGEGSLNGFAKTIEAAVHELAHRYQGMDPFQVETIFQRMTRDMYSDGGQIHTNATAAVETACWDIIGKETGRPVYDLLGGQYRARLPVYANGWYQGDRTPEVFAERARMVVSRGYKALKFDPFGAAWRHMDTPDRRLTMDICRAVRDAVGPDVQLMIEGHRRFSVAEAIKIGHELARSTPTWFEEPTDHTKIDATAEVARKLPSPSPPARASRRRTSSPSSSPTTRSTSSSPDPSRWAASSGPGWSARWPTPSTAWLPPTRPRVRSRPRSASRSAPARRTCSSRSCSTTSTSPGSATSSPGTRRSTRTARSTSRPARPGLRPRLRGAGEAPLPGQQLPAPLLPGWERRESVDPAIAAADEDATPA
jgi:hypothetical protein